ncbi:hypothetical protein [Kitasatospora sp. CB02891]|uniref:hypothetical protein n=1 Tax=Kitasatospora sp. CB02891 TaxID=2020329 RepID=UPI000C272CB6|nr:hypothetical protein [Kitasatospora sp. CB02891]PJN30022.1 hypothetical protein CG736_02760 [Kitasatospora sp. CB02891]
MNWYGVRCVFEWTAASGRSYEERITLWRAPSADDAIALAEVEAETYARESGVEYLGFAQSYRLGDHGVPGAGAEVFSLLRDSSLEPSAYLDAYFDTGAERQQPLPDGLPGG